MKARLVSLNLIRMLALLAVPMAAGRGQIEEAKVRYPTMAPFSDHGVSGLTGPINCLHDSSC